MITFAYRRVNIKTGEVFEGTVTAEMAESRKKHNLAYIIQNAARYAPNESSIVVDSGKAEFADLLAEWNHGQPERAIYGPI